MKTAPDKVEKDKLDRFDRQWEMQFYELQKFKEKHGHCDVPQTYKNKQYRSLAEWCSSQREAKKFTPLKYSPDREKKLTELGFSWNMHEKWFNIKFRQLKQYHKKHGHCNVRWDENPVLTNWCVKVKRARLKKVSTLTNEMIARLDELDFPWHNRRKETNELLWEQQFGELKDYKEKHGHCDVPVSREKKNKYYILGRWCTTQRVQRNHNPPQYPLDRLKRLNKIGFCWDIKDKWFEEQFQQLEKYFEKYGHCNVSATVKSGKYYTLGRWCTTQRVQRKYNPLEYPPDRLEKLNKLGFSWDALDERFENRFRQLIEYCEKHGHCNVSKKENKELAHWCANLRRARKKKSKILSVEKIKRLTDFGFEWYEVKEEKNELRWEEQFNRLKEYKKKHGHCNMPRIHNSHDPEYHLSNWVTVQRRCYRSKNKNLTTKRIAKLNGIGFNWINPIKMGDERRISDKELLDELKRLYGILGKPPSAKYINQHGKYTRKPYYTRFGSITNAHKAAGIGSTDYLRKYSTAQLLDDLKRLAATLDKVPTSGDVGKHGKYPAHLYYQRFGGIRKARKIAGVDSVSTSRINPSGML